MTNNEKMNQPRLRFAGFTDAWVQRKFEELLDAKEGVRRGPFGSALKKDLFVDSSDYVVYEQQNAIYDQYETRYNITEEKFNELKKFEILPGDYIMSGAGTIGRISEVPSGIKRGVFNQALIRFRINPEVTNKEYFLTYMRGDIMQRKLTGANPGSAITNLVPMSEVKKYDIAIPSLEEQAKIGALLTTLDNLIAANQRKVNELQELKKSYLQKIFNQELRFAGFTDAWVQRNLTELSDGFSYGLNAAAKEYDGVHGYLRITDIDEASHLFLPEGLTSPDVPEDQLQDYKMDEQSIVYARTGASTGKTYIYRDSDGELYYAGFLIRQKVNKETSAQFVYQNTLTKAWERYVQVMSQRSGQPGINAQEVGRFELAIPEKAEQDKIANLFNSLDNLIAANQHKVELLQKQKAGYLQQMFV
jgi:type I restriction enzyme S subunit